MQHKSDMDTWFEKFLGGLLIFLMGVCLLGLIAIPILWYLDSKEPNFSLKKADWACTSAHQETNMVMVGKVMVPQTDTICDQWTRR